jgi:hypothetical protein
MKRKVTDLVSRQELDVNANQSLGPLDWPSDWPMPAPLGKKTAPINEESGSVTEPGNPSDPSLPTKLIDALEDLPTIQQWKEPEIE